MSQRADASLAMTSEAMANAVVWGADDKGTVGVAIYPILNGQFDLGIGVARRQRPPARRGAPQRPPKVSVSNAAGMTLEDAERVHERLGEMIARVKDAKRAERKDRDAGRSA